MLPVEERPFMAVKETSSKIPFLAPQARAQRSGAREKAQP